MTPEKATQRVTRAATVLDRVLPGWAAFINVKTLDMETADRCICGQLWLWSSTGIIQTARDWHAIEPAVMSHALFENLDLFTEAWLLAIADRTAPAAFPITKPAAVMVTT